MHYLLNYQVNLLNVDDVLSESFSLFPADGEATDRHLRHSVKERIWLFHFVLCIGGNLRSTEMCWGGLLVIGSLFTLVLLRWYMPCLLSINGWALHEWGKGTVTNCTTLRPFDEDEKVCDGIVATSRRMARCLVNQNQPE